jgi:hypothetical protein
MTMLAHLLAQLSPNLGSSLQAAVSQRHSLRDRLSLYRMQDRPLSIPSFLLEAVADDRGRISISLDH